VVDGDDAVGSRRAAVVDDGGVALDPHPAAAPSQPPVVLGRRLALQQHCNQDPNAGNYYGLLRHNGSMTYTHTNTQIHPLEKTAKDF